MDQIQRFNIIVATVTVVIMYLVIEFILPMLQASAVPARLSAWIPFVSADQIVALSKVVLTALASVGAYKLIANFLVGAIERLPLLKAYIFNASYIEGTWVGRFIDSHSGPKWTVEHFEQSLGGIVLRGWATNNDGSRYADWESDTVSIDAKKGIVRFAYDCDVFHKNTRQQGIGVFKVTKRGLFKTPTAMSGYSADLTDGQRTENNEIKVSSSHLELGQAIRKARETFQ